MSADTPSPFGPSGRAGARLTDVEAVKADAATELVRAAARANLGLELPPDLCADIREVLAEHLAEHRDAQAFVGPLS